MVLSTFLLEDTCVGEAETEVCLKLTFRVELLSYVGQFRRNQHQ